ncbi:hypothetical protein GCM10023169_24650 [Georgenia halophila]|uniref:Uncharacterized protein n=1 Tax=Georgenia halophila TaxID=620889 RepID=A0ABP8LCT4_9MICO
MQVFDDEAKCAMTEIESVRIVAALRGHLMGLDEWRRASLLRDIVHVFDDHALHRTPDGRDGPERRSLVEVVGAVDAWWDQAAVRRAGTR